MVEKQSTDRPTDRTTHLTADLLAGGPRVAHAGVVLGEVSARERRAGLRHGEEVSAGLRAGTAVGLAGLLRQGLLGIELAEGRAVERLTGLRHGPDGTAGEWLREHQQNK